MKTPSNTTIPILALILLTGLAPLLPAQSPPGPPPGPPGDTMKSLQEIWDEIRALKAQNEAIMTQLNILLETQGAGSFMEMVPVGNPGNAGDPSTFDRYGAVPYAYKIGKHEVTNAQYAQFLNAVAAEDPNNLYKTSMSSVAVGGITRSGASPNFTYAVKAFMGNKPVIYVSWFDAARFCNWLHNGRPTGAQGPATTEGGAYTLTSPTGFAPGTDPVHGANGRNAGARFWLPGEDEWFKAAYHQPAGQGGDADDYWLYPTRSNTAPAIATADLDGNIDNDTANIANCERGADWNGQDGNVTTVGSGGAGSASFYGAFDMGGNVSEWIELFLAGDAEIRGGSWVNSLNDLKSSSNSVGGPALETSFIGFRVASP